MDGVEVEAVARQAECNRPPSFSTTARQAASTQIAVMNYDSVSRNQNRQDDRMDRIRCFLGRRLVRTRNPVSPHSGPFLICSGSSWQRSPSRRGGLEVSRSLQSNQSHQVKPVAPSQASRTESSQSHPVKPVAPSQTSRTQSSQSHPVKPVAPSQTSRTQSNAVKPSCVTR